MKHYWYLWLIAAIGLWGMQGCRSGKEGSRVVSVSILPQKYLVERIAGEYVQVNVLVPPGMNPATCDLSTGQLRKLYDSDLCFTIGHLPFETTHLYPVLAARREVRVVNHSEGMPLLGGSCNHSHPAGEGHAHGSVDPHIWLSPTRMGVMAEQVFRALAEAYPEQREAFGKRYRTLAEEIAGIGRKASEALAGKAGRVFLIYHPALTYLAEEYGLEQVAIENEGKEPDPAHLKALVDLAREKGIRLVFIQSQFDAGNARSVAREIGGEVVPIDPLAEAWAEEMGRLLDILEEKL